MPFPPGMISTYQFPLEYFSGSDLSLYWNDKYLLEVVGLTFQLMESVQPIYGWNSYVYDRIARGARQITGKFQVALVVPDMVRQTLQTIKAAQDAPKGATDQSQTTETIQGGTADDYARMEQAALEKRFGVKYAPSAHMRSYFPTMNGLDLVIRFGATDDPTVFSSVSAPSEANAYKLTGVEILAFTHQVPTDGSPVLELYSFLAKDLVPITSN